MRSSLNWVNIKLTISRGVLVCLIVLTSNYVTYYSILAHVSSATIFSITTASTFTTALAFYLIFNEKLNFFHILGMIIMVIGIVIAAISK